MFVFAGLVLSTEPELHQQVCSAGTVCIEMGSQCQSWKQTQLSPLHVLLCNCRSISAFFTFVFAVLLNYVYLKSTMNVKLVCQAT